MGPTYNLAPCMPTYLWAGVLCCRPQVAHRQVSFKYVYLELATFSALMKIQGRLVPTTTLVQSFTLKSPSTQQCIFVVTPSFNV